LDSNALIFVENYTSLVTKVKRKDTWRVEVELETLSESARNGRNGPKIVEYHLMGKIWINNTIDLWDTSNNGGKGRMKTQNYYK
jgi:hypothetical protein